MLKHFTLYLNQGSLYIEYVEMTHTDLNKRGYVLTQAAWRSRHGTDFQSVDPVNQWYYHEQFSFFFISWLVIQHCLQSEAKPLFVL